MSDPIYAVFSPQGRSSGTALDQPEAVRDLSTAVVAEVWDMAFRGDEVFAVLEQELRPRFPGPLDVLNTIPHTISRGIMHHRPHPPLLSAGPVCTVASGTVPG